MVLLITGDKCDKRTILVTQEMEILMRIIRIVLCVLLMLSISTDGFAFTSASSYIPCDCGMDDCICFIQLGDSGGFVKGIVDLLIEQNYLDANVPKNQFSGNVRSAVEQFQNDHNLPATGMMDDDTLTLLIWGMLPEELDAVMPVKKSEPETYPDTVYVPTDGGKKRHSNPECSDMYDPRKVSIRNAAKLKYDACKKCEAERERLLY